MPKEIAQQCCGCKIMIKTFYMFCPMCGTCRNCGGTGNAIDMPCSYCSGKGKRNEYELDRKIQTNNDNEDNRAR